MTTKYMKKMLGNISHQGNENQNCIRYQLALVRIEQLLSKNNSNKISRHGGLCNPNSFRNLRQEDCGFEASLSYCTRLPVIFWWRWGRTWCTGSCLTPSFWGDTEIGRIAVRNHPRQKVQEGLAELHKWHSACPASSRP